MREKKIELKDDNIHLVFIEGIGGDGSTNYFTQSLDILRIKDGVAFTLVDEDIFTLIKLLKRMVDGVKLENSGRY
jgi:hypothetical protein